MKATILIALFLFAAAAATGCQDTDPAGQEPARAKLAEDMTNRPASQRWFWWGGDVEQPPAPDAKTSLAGQE